MVAGVGVVVVVVGVVVKGAVAGDAVVTAGVSGVYKEIKNKECQMMDFQRKKTRRGTLRWAVIPVITRCRSQESSKAINNNQYYIDSAHHCYYIDSVHHC